LIDAKFFNTWSQSVGFQSNEASFAALKKEKLRVMDNSTMVLPFHEKRVKEIQMDIDFKVIPESLFGAFSRWFDCKTVISRKVVKLKAKGQKPTLMAQNSANGLEEPKEEEKASFGVRKQNVGYKSGSKQTMIK